MAQNTDEIEKEEDGLSLEQELPVEPFNPKDIVIEVKPVTIETVLRRLKQDSLKLAPDFQRDEVWNPARKSRLIESLMLNIPIPIFYVSADDRGVWSVVDGLQRLSAIKEFILDKSYSLTNLEFWGEHFDGRSMDELPPLQYNQIMETVFQFVIISPSTPEKVKRNIFKRINTGGMPLSAQEIRHALYNGPGTKFLKDLVDLESFKVATGRSVNDSRMAAREIVLRALAFFSYGERGYKEPDMDDFLCTTLKMLNAMNQESLSKISERFSKSMKRCYELFGLHSFRISIARGGARSPVNKALFEVLASVLMRMDDDEYSNVFKRKEDVFHSLCELIRDPLFYRSISRDSWKGTNVIYRYKKIKEMFGWSAND